MSAARRPASRGVALINALVVVAALAAISAALLVRAQLAVERQALRGGTDQLAAYLDAGQAQALAELAINLDQLGDQGLRLGLAWEQPREVPIDRGRLAWRFEDLQGRFNLVWLASETEWGDLARAAFVRLAAEQGLGRALTDRLLAAAGPDAAARAQALGAGAAPDLPLNWPGLLAGVARAADGGPAALAPLWPLLAALPPEAGLNPATAPLPVLAALLPGPSDRDWEDFEAARRLGMISGPETMVEYAERFWPEETLDLLMRLPMTDEPAWFGLTLQAWLDSATLRRSAVVSLAQPDMPGPSAPRVVFSLPIVP